jgi:adenylate kinase family enzyme
MPKSSGRLAAGTATVLALLSPPVVSGASGYSCQTEAVEAGVRDESRRSAVISRVVVTGMAGAGKSTFSRQLAAKTGLPLIHLDLHAWRPGWVRVPDDELVEIQRTLLAGRRWIVDSNDVDEDLLVAHADTLVVITTQWWVCSWRAFRRGLRRPAETQLPEGCEESFSQRIGDEWGIAWRNWRNRKTVPENDRRLAERCADLMDVHLLSNKQELTDFLRRFPE